MRRLYLSQENSKIAGVCGGIGESYDMDPTLVRMAFVFLCLATSIVPGVVTYLIAWVIIPKNQSSKN